MNRVRIHRDEPDWEATDNASNKLQLGSNRTQVLGNEREWETDLALVATPLRSGVVAKLVDTTIRLLSQEPLAGALPTLSLIHI